MRLSKIKMSGFKSFVDPTSLNLPSAMVGIVGPNGCGKSNIIDAVRWVMGETSKHIRGDSVEDIIFNGSSGRKPVGQASIELVFDNTDRKLGGQYAEYDEIAIRRQVTRDGQSKYFLNSTRCRRRDIVDIFLGTGLGPRSYAIIEQGMISRLIDAKPEELRIYLEEAAGISKYKERRRETETRIRHTRENLDRLHDLIEEVEKQLSRLKRQAEAAEKYKEFKAEEQRAQAEWLLLRLKGVEAEQTQNARHVEELRTELEKCISSLRSVEADIEKHRVAHTEANETLNQVQGRFYQVGADLSRLEQALQHAREQKQRQTDELRKVQQALQSNQAERTQHQNDIDLHRNKITELEPQLDALDVDLSTAQATLEDVERSVSNAQEAWDQLMQEMNDPSQIIQTQSSRVHFIEREIERLQSRREKLGEESRHLEEQEFAREIDELERGAESRANALQHIEAEVGKQSEAIQGMRTRVSEYHQQIDADKSQRQRLLGEQSSLQALQDAALKRSDKPLAEWIQARQLGAPNRLAEEIDVETEWTRAVETVLGDYLEALCVPNLTELAHKLSELQSGQVLLVDSFNHSQGNVKAGTLASRVKTSLPIVELLNQILIADDLPSAMQLREELQDGQSIITRDGVWLGRHWARFSRALADERSVLERKSRIAELSTELQSIDQRIATLEEEYAQSRDQLSSLERSRDAAQNERNAINRQYTDVQAQLARKKAACEHWEQRKEQVRNDLQEVEVQSEDYQQQLQVARDQQQTARASLESLEQQKQGLQQKRSDLKNSLEAARQNHVELKDQRHHTQVQLETSRAHMSSAEQLMQRIEQQNGELQTRLQSAEQELQACESPITRLSDELNGHLELRVDVEAELIKARKALGQIDEYIRECEERRAVADQSISEQRERLDEGRMKWQEFSVRAQTMREELSSYPWSEEQLSQDLPEDAKVQDWQERVEHLDRKIRRLGPINLAAIEEFQEQSERKEYLDRQNDDLSEALQTLETAIRKIDKETKERFAETFEKVNHHLGEMYARLFPSGKAYLEMTGDDLLTTGVSIMARPPGKRVSSIHLLSGGEKALTAVALVLAIFVLNPAPFCLLDEVDAPLDEANVGRFCDLIKDMSETVQFIFITHNKVTMEYADHLLGVTMNEPGVSRLVSVDVDAAEKLASSA